MPASNALLISDFLGYLQYERGATEKAIVAHERTLAHLAAWLEPCWLPDATRIMLQLYMGDSLKQGTGAQTVARRLSHLRHFYQFLLNEQEIVSAPTQDLSMPTRWSTAKAKGAVTVATWVRIDSESY